MQEQIKQIEAKVAECIRIAEDTFCIKMPAVSVRFDLRGKAAGQAGCRNTWGGERSGFYLRFNRQHMAMGGQTWLHLLNDTVPHEVAHTVCQAFPVYGRNHNPGWKRVCRALGGNGERCYSDSDAPEAVAKQSPYVYTTTNGHEVRVSKVIHGKIQRGSSYRFKHGKGSVTSDCAYLYSATPTANELGEQTKTEEVIPPITKAPKHTPTAKAITRSKNGGKKISNADMIRKQIAMGRSEEDCIAYGVNVLGMKRALAKTYVKNNWNKA